MTTLEVLRRSPGASVGYGLLFASSLVFFCLLGIPTTLALVVLVGRQLDGALVGRARERESKFRGGLFVFLFVAVVVFAAVGGATAAKMLLPTVADDPRSLLGVVVALGVAFAILLPYSFVPLVLRDEAVPSGVGGHAFVVSAQGITRLPLARRIALVFVPLTVQVIPYALFTFLEGPETLLDAVGASLLAYAVLVPIGTAHYVAAYATVREELESDPLEDDPVAVPPALRAAGVSAALSAGVLLFLFAQALLVPLPMTSVPPDLDPLSPVPQTEPIRVGDGQVFVRSAEGGVTVAARDGGGVGFVASGCGAIGRVAVVEVDHAYRIVATCESGFGGVVEMRVDAGGVRLDDSFTHRIGARISGWCYALLAVSLLLWALSFGGPWRAFQRVRHLRSLARTDELDRGPGLRALEGTLHAEAGVEVGGGRFRSAGSAQISGGPLRITLPAEGPVLGSEQATLADGSRVAVVGHFQTLISDGLRQGPAPWPEDGVLVPGGRREAAERLSRAAGRRLAILFGAVTAAQGVTAVVLVLSW